MLIFKIKVTQFKIMFYINVNLSTECIGVISDSDVIPGREIRAGSRRKYLFRLLKWRIYAFPFGNNKNSSYAQFRWYTTCLTQPLVRASSCSKTQYNFKSAFPHLFCHVTYNAKTQLQQNRLIVMINLCILCNTSWIWTASGSNEGNQ